MRPPAFAVAQVLRHIGPYNGVAAAEVALTATGFAAVVAIEGLARAVRPDLRSRPMALRLTVLIGDARVALVLAFTAALLLSPARWTWVASSRPAGGPDGELLPAAARGEPGVPSPSHIGRYPDIPAPPVLVSR